MIERIKKLLKQQNIDTYQINVLDKESFQLYFVHEKVETIRKVVFTDISVNLFIHKDGKIGGSKFVLYSTSSDEEIKEKIKEASTKALSTLNEPHELVKGDKPLEFISEPFIKGKELKEVAEEIATTIFNTPKSNKNATLNATEIFINKYVNHIVNSNNLDKCETFYTGMIETIPTFNKKDESVEIYAQKNFNTFDKDELTKYIQEQLFEVEARANATKEELPSKLAVVLRSEEIASILRNYQYDLSYSSLYAHANMLKKGDRIQNEDAPNKITLSVCGNIKGCSLSSNFDEDGSEYKDRTIIKDGEVVSFYGPNRFAQYLKEENTGNLKICKLEPGNLTKDDLNGKEYLECLQFSGIQSDILNNYVGGEVRLAIYHKDGKAIPVTGFSISAKLSDVLNTIRLSKEITHDPVYCGPKFALFDGFTIL